MKQTNYEETVKELKVKNQDFEEKLDNMITEIKKVQCALLTATNNT